MPLLCHVVSFTGANDEKVCSLLTAALFDAFSCLESIEHILKTSFLRAGSDDLTVFSRNPFGSAAQCLRNTAVICEGGRDPGSVACLILTGHFTHTACIAGTWKCKETY